MRPLQAQVVLILDQALDPTVALTVVLMMRETSNLKISSPKISRLRVKDKVKVSSSNKMSQLINNSRS